MAVKGNPQLLVLLFLLCAGVPGCISQESEGELCVEDHHGPFENLEAAVIDDAQNGRSLLQTCWCGGHGQCVTILLGQSVCDCEEGFSGADCTQIEDCAALGDCNQRGICIKGGTCACDLGWTGSDCTIGLCPKNCSGHGACNQTTGHCHCNAGWEGRSCSIRGCDANCTQNGICIEGTCECNPGFTGPNCENFVCINECSENGICDETLQRCECSPWFTGEDCGTALCPRDCMGHGSCVKGLCVCDEGYSGFDCSSHLCPQACSGRGTCTTDGICVCQTGFTGDACDLLTSCPIYDCSGHGTCRLAPYQNATCECDPGWSGVGCSEFMVLEAACKGNCSSHGACVNGTICLCDLGWSGDDCSVGTASGGDMQCPGDCSQHGTCMNGTCICDLGWGNPDCSLADSAILCGSNCSSGVGTWMNGTCKCEMGSNVSTVPCPMDCSGRGACMNGTCACDVGYMGAGCEQMIPGPAGPCLNNCSLHGSCANGTCICDMGWDGNDCSIQSSVGAGGNCPGNCTGHGSCTLNYTCLCDPGYLGPDCSMDAATASACAFNCSNHGMCVNSTCICEPGYEGSWCEGSGPGSTPMPKGIANNSDSVFTQSMSPCPGDGSCSNHGSCVNTACICDPFYSGETCEHSSFLVSGCSNDCSQHGTCLNGTCVCDPAWDGEDCSYPSMCPGYSGSSESNCSDHGSCMNGTCVCDPNWGGMDCSIAACPGGCTGHGVCANGTCACDPGWSGAECNELGCPNGCSGHGACQVTPSGGVCVCDSGWTGSGCSLPQCPTSADMMNPYTPCSGHGACYQNGTCLCYKDYAGADCSILVDCNGRGSRRCGFCDCEEGFDGDECELDVCADSRIYDSAAPDDWRRADVCSNRGNCTTLGGCVCQVGWAGKNCSTPAKCVGPNGLECSGQGKCSGSRDDPGTCECNKFDIAETPHDTPMYTGRYCDVLQCPGYRRASGTISAAVCSGKGNCVVINNVQQCSCFNVQGQGPYTGSDCGVPPKFFVSDISPKVGPLEGGTIVRVVGPGLERFVARMSPQVVYCDFEADTRLPARLGDTTDSLICETTGVPNAKIVYLTFTDIVGVELVDATGLPYVSGRDASGQKIVSFEYYTQTRIVRISPSFGPLRPQGTFRGPTVTNQPNLITVTGTYFPPEGEYGCRFGDCDAPVGTSVRIDLATVVCQMPTLASSNKLPLSVTSNMQQYSSAGGSEAAYTVYGITSVSPKCGASVGTATVTVYGDNLVDPEDQSRVPSKQYCRFGSVSLLGLTKSAGQPYDFGWKMYAYHSQAAISTRSVGALECKVPDWPLEVNYFAVTLDGTYLATDANDGFYVGQWDATDTVTFDTYYPPQIIIQSGVGNQVYPHPYIVAPTLGPVAGGTRVTIAGMGFDYARYGPDSGNDVYPAWRPPKENCNPAPIPSCKFGDAITTRVEFINNETLVCLTPLLPDQIDNPLTVPISVALDGQTFSTEVIQFQFLPVHKVFSVEPSMGVRGGGTLFTVTGEKFVASFTDGNGGSPDVLTCVFVSERDPSIRLISTSARFITPETITCVTPAVPAPATYFVDVSLSGQEIDSQISGSTLSFIFYQDPVISQLVDPIGTIYGGEDVILRGLFFVDLPTIKCKFGDIEVPGTYITVPAPSVKCTAPPVDVPQTVNVETTMNGIDWSVSNPSQRYTFYNLTYLSPSSGPAHGGTSIYVKIYGGPSFNQNTTNFVYTAKFGDLPTIVPGFYDAVSDTITFPPLIFPVGSGNLAVLAPNRRKVPFGLSLTDSQIYKSFPGRDFILYKTTFKSIVPCKMGDCNDLVLPKTNLPYPITFTGLGLEDVDSIECGFIPITSTPNQFLSYAKSNPPTKPPITTKGLYSPADNATGCLAPPLDVADANNGYLVSVAQNGQVFDAKVFTLIYLPPPTVDQLSAHGGLANGGLSVTVTSNMRWTYPTWYRNGSTPDTLSCIFFIAAGSFFQFSEALNPVCDSTKCTAVCKTPNFFGRVTDDDLVKTQVFLSLNRRDPCMRCGCAVGQTFGVDGFGKTTCSSVATDDRVTQISRYDALTNGFCSTQQMVVSDAHFCANSQNICPVVSGATSDKGQYFSCLGDVYQYFTFYTPPILEKIVPSSIGGQAQHNTTIVMQLSGEHFKASSWASWPWAPGFVDCSPSSNPPCFIHVRATYRDAMNVTKVLNATFIDQDSIIQFELPIPCNDVIQEPGLLPRIMNDLERGYCFNKFGMAFNQTRNRMLVDFAVSFNQGQEYTRSNTVLNVYKEQICPTDEAGCGHGTCVDTGSTTAPRCMCGYWTNTSSCNYRNPNFIVSQTSTNPFCAANSIFYNVDDNWTPSQLFSQFGDVARWPKIGQATNGVQLGCTIGPQMTQISPTVGVLGGGTTLTVTLKVVQLYNEWKDYTTNEDNVKIRLDTYFTCFFGSPYLRSPATFVSVSGLNAVYQCKVPSVPSGADLSMYMSFVNPLGVPSPYVFRGQVIYKFAKLPTVTGLQMWVNGDIIQSPYLSAPVCEGACPEVVQYFSIVVNGYDFLDTTDLACRINGFKTQAFYLSPTQVRCSLANATGGVVRQPGSYKVEVSLNGQNDEFAPKSGNFTYVDFYQQPAVVKDVKRSFGVDPGQVGSKLTGILGTIPCGGGSCNTLDSEYFRLGPTSGGTPLVMYFREAANSTNLVDKWSKRSTLSIRFDPCIVACPTCSSFDARQMCTCNDGPTAHVQYSGAVTGDESSFQIIHKLTAFTPSMTDTGRFMMCFSLNSVHYMPMFYVQQRREVTYSRRQVALTPFFFRFYNDPIVTKLSITEGPITLAKGYNISLIGSNFPVKRTGACDYIQTGLCASFAPRIFIYFGTYGTNVTGYGSQATDLHVPLDDPRITIESDSKLTFAINDLSLISATNFVANVTVSFNGYDFTPVMKDVTEFSFYVQPEVYSLTPIWGHYDASTQITITGKNFQNSPTRSMCRIASCTEPCLRESEVKKVLVPATYVSPTTITCQTSPRPPSIEDDTARSMYISYTPDGRASTKRDNEDLYEKLVLPIGKFSLTNAINYMNISAKAGPTTGGSLFEIVVINHRKVDKTCFDFNDVGNQSLVVAFIPTSSVWKTARPGGYGDFLKAEIRYPIKFVEESVLVASQVDKTCLMYINVSLPVVPYPLTADVKISLNYGQQFTGPKSTILFFHPIPPNMVVPSRGMAAGTARPTVSIFFDTAPFEGANPELTLVQTDNAFKVTAGACKRSTRTICAVGPMCMFSHPSYTTIVTAQFKYDPFRSELTCVAPQYPNEAEADLLITLDGVELIKTPLTFFFFNPPFVQAILPTNGYWDAQTQILVSGHGFLPNPNGTHFSWCVFDFRDVRPASDAWDYRRLWTKAYPLPDTNNSIAYCRSPVIASAVRPQVPANPRARVGIIVDGICLEEAFGQCITLKNSDSVMQSDAFFLYANIPSVSRATPRAGMRTGGLSVTIAGSGFMDQYRVGPPYIWNQALNPSGFVDKRFDRLCPAATATSPQTCPGLSCRFGRYCPVGLACIDRIVDGALLNGDVVCTAPPFESSVLTQVNLSVSLNGMTNEFSNSIPFTYTDMTLTELTPKEGTAFGGGLVSVKGSQFVNVPCAAGSTKDCLQCRFTAGTGFQKFVKATYVTSELVLCEVPPSTEFGLTSVTDACLSACELIVAISVNGVEFVGGNPPLTYKFTKKVFFINFEPMSGPITGSTNITVTGEGFDPFLRVTCKVGNQTVPATYMDPTHVFCQTPAVSKATNGGVFMGFSVNNVDYCELLTGPGQTGKSCNFTRSPTPSQMPFYYHDVMNATGISPRTGRSTGKTRVVITGNGFTNYGQSVFVQFGNKMEPATILSPTRIEVLSPPLPTDMTIGGMLVYTLDVAVPVTVTSNNQQFTQQQIGQACPPPALQNDNNPKATCTLPFVMFSWHKLPSVFSLSTANNVPGFYANLNQVQFTDLGIIGATLPQGPLSGGTEVMIRGADFTSFSRVEIVDGGGVFCPDGRGVEALPGKACTTPCTFPFTQPGTSTQSFYYRCINTRRSADQVGYSPNQYWCAVGGNPPATYNGEYGICREQISEWKDYYQGGTVITRLECLFGEVHVPAKIIDNSTISCVAPPHQYGVMVPVSVTLNRADYTDIVTQTWFQYVAPAPVATTAVPSSTVSTIQVNFNVETNLAGQQTRVLQSTNPAASGCTALFDPEFVAKLGKTAPSCEWVGNKTIQITLGFQPTFNINEVVRFNKRPCEAAGNCWKDRTPMDLLLTPWVVPGCYYSENCNRESGSHLLDWCGRCIPNTQGIITNQLSYPFNQSATTLRISYPVNPSSPVPVITGPSQVDSCGRLCFGGVSNGQSCASSSDCSGGTCMPGLVTLRGDSSGGNLGRAFSRVSWVLDPLATTDFSLDTMVKGLADLVAVIPASTQVTPPKGTVSKYCFKLTLMNWLNLSSTSAQCFLVQATQDVPLPSITVFGGMNRNAPLSSDFSIQTSIAPSSCAGNDTTIVIAWDLYPQATGWGSGTFSKNSMNLMIPVGDVAFQSGTMYRFRVNATLVYGKQINEAMTSQSVYVTFDRMPPVAQLSGGAVRATGYMNEVSIDGSGSHDPNIVASARHATDLIYCWQCSQTNATHTGVPCPWATKSNYEAHTGMNWTDSKLVLKPGLLRARTTYTITLVVGSNVNNRICSDINLQQDSDADRAVSTLEVTAFAYSPKVAMVAPVFTTITNSDPIRLGADVQSSSCPATGDTTAQCAVEYYWEVIPAFEVEDQGKITTGRSGPNAMLGGYGRVRLVIQPNALKRSEYTFKLFVKQADGSTAYSQMTFRNNLAPAGGIFNVTPAVGYSLNTKFTFTCSSWEDTDFPLKYKYWTSVFTYDSAQVVSATDIMSLGAPQFETTLVTFLPQGNLNDNNQMAVYATIYDSAGARTSMQPFQVQVNRYALSSDGMNLKNQVDSILAGHLNNGRKSQALTFIGLVGAVTNDAGTSSDAGFRSPSVLNALLATRAAMMKTIMQITGNARREFTRICEPSTVDVNLLSGGLGTAFKYGVASLPATANKPTESEINSAEDLVCLIKNIGVQGTTLDAIFSDETTKLTELMDAIAMIQDTLRGQPESVFVDIKTAIRGLLITYMKGKDQYRNDRNGMLTLARRLSKTSNGATISIESMISFKDTVLSKVSGVPAEGADIVVIGYQYVCPDPLDASQCTGPYRNSNQPVSSRTIGITMHPALSTTSTATPSQVTDLVVTNLQDPINVQLSVKIVPEKKLNTTTGVFSGTVCAWWNTSAGWWNQFGKNYITSAAGGTINCPSYHLTEFSTVPGQVGCDNNASLTPKILNECQECGGGVPSSMQGICNWLGKPCANSAPRDKCGVCGGKGQAFISELNRTQSGICDFQGIPCGKGADGTQQEPSVCGICGPASARAETSPSVGICDCQGTGVPNGGKQLDRCGICDGRNATMDACGRNPTIPLSYVCHTGGVTTRWNSSCTGCDGVPRPDLPWRRPIQAGDPVWGLGGVQIDYCGICGGDNSNCTGCDGVLGSGAIPDVCGVCRGNGTTCIGCDAVARPVPLQIDGCGVCGGNHFGTCGCDYKTLTPHALCKQGCDGIANSGKVFDKCGVCGGDGSSCAALGSGRNGQFCSAQWTRVSKCGCGFEQDACGQCGGNGSACLGCDGVPFSGKVVDACGICDGDNSSCIGCDGVVLSGKVLDVCGECDGQNRKRDLCGVCNGDDSSCSGCDNIPHSGRSVDACGVCGGTNLCKWRNGNVPEDLLADVGPDYKAVTRLVELEPSSARSLRSNPGYWLISVLLCVWFVIGMDDGGLRGGRR